MSEVCAPALSPPVSPLLNPANRPPIQIQEAELPENTTSPRETTEANRF